jgi:superfamily II DNA helicase RecQ
MHNINRVILWGLPSSFCALAQRAGRAGRDFATDAEAILIVSPTTFKEGLSEADIEKGLQRVLESDESENRNEEDVTMDLAAAEVQLTKGNETTSVEEVGVPLAHDSEEEDAPASSAATKTRQKRTAQDFNSRKVKYMNLFVAGQQCWRKTWDDFLSNNKKT